MSDGGSKTAKIVMIVAAGLASAGLIVGVIKLERHYRKYRQDLEIKKNMAVESTLLTYEREAMGGKMAAVLKSLAKMDESELTRDQVRRRLMLMGDINADNYKNPKLAKEKQYYLDLAVKFYRRATGYSDNERQRNLIMERIGELYVSNGEWRRALNLFKDSDTALMMPEERWKLKLNMAQCHCNMKEFGEAVRLLTQICDECDNDDIWANALRQKADILLKASVNEAVARSVSGSADAKLADLSAKFRENAGKLYREIIKEVPVLNPDSSLAHIGLLEITVLNKNKKDAYEMANKIQSLPLQSKEKIEALILLAKLEEDTGGDKVALEILETCLKRHPKTVMRTQISMTLYGLYKKTDDWTKAFSVAEELFLNNPDKDTVTALINDFSPGRNKMFNVISSSYEKDLYVKRIKFMLNSIKNSWPAIWEGIKNQGTFMFATLLYINDKYEETEKELVECMNMPGNPRDLVEKIYYVDLLCAIKSGASDATVVARARRYLAFFPKGLYYKEALGALLDSYYRMEMFTPAIATAKKIYVDEIYLIRGGSMDEGEQSIWLKTVARMGQCYEKMGLLDKAGKIFKTYSRKFAGTPYAGELYMDWAGLAREKGQFEEAVRRLEVAIPELKDANDKARLQTEKYVVKLRMGDKDDFQKATNLLEVMERSSKIDPELKKRLMKRLTEALLEFAYSQKMPREFNELVDVVIRDYKNETWPEYWVLRSLSPLFGTRDLAAIKKRQEEALQGGFAQDIVNKENVKFIDHQFRLISELDSIEKSYNRMKQEKGL